jgi:glutamine---fructose-6-phosphate transaminase (isomerizing)
MSGYREDILAQPDALRSTLTALEKTTFPEEIGDGVRQGRWPRILLTGMGSSYFTLLPLYHRLLAASCPAWLVETSELLYSPAFLRPGSLIIAASQSGASGETVHLLQKLPPETTLIGLTNTVGSPLERGSTCSVVTRAGSESTVSCKTYVTALAAQCWLGDQICPGPLEFPGLLDLPDQVEDYLSHTSEHVHMLSGLLESVRQVYLAGRGVSLPSAGTGGLILKESVHIAAEGMSSAAFRHGPIEMVGPETFVLVFAGQGETVALNRRLYNDILRLGGRAAWVEPNGGTGVFDLPSSSSQALPVLEVLPVQMLTLALGELRHITPGSFSVASKVTDTE